MFGKCVEPVSLAGGFDSRECGRPANDEEFADACKRHGAARRKTAQNAAKRMEARAAEEARRVAAQELCDDLAALTGVTAAPHYGGVRQGTYDGGIVLTHREAALLLARLHTDREATV